MAIKDTLEIINRMQADRVISKYAIGGAVGATFYLEPSATEDLDVFVDLPTAADSGLTSLSTIYEYLGTRGSKPEGAHIVVGEWPVQFLPVANDLQREALEGATQVDVEGVPTTVIGAEYLVAIALQTGRLKDHARVMQFLEQDAVDVGKLESVLQKHALWEKWCNLKSKLR